MSDLVELPPWTGQLAMSASSMATFRTCPRMYELQFLRKLSPESFYAPFFIGDMIHEGLERFYRGDHPREIVTEVEDKIWVKLQDVFVPEADQKKVQKDVSIVSGMLLGYFKHYGPKERAAWQDIKVEMGFDLAWHDGMTRNWGRMDMAGVFVNDGNLWVVEHKSTGASGGSYLAKWHMSFQVHNYFWAACRAHELGHLPQRPVGVMVNVIKKPGIRLRMKETQEQFNLRLMNEYLTNPGKYFVREWVPLGDKDLEWYERHQDYWVKKLRECYAQKYFPMNTDNCEGKFNTTCRFFPVCWGHNKSGDTDALRFFRVREKQFEEVPEVDITDTPAS